MIDQSDPQVIAAEAFAERFLNLLEVAYSSLGRAKIRRLEFNQFALTEGTSLTLAIGDGEEITLSWVGSNRDYT